MSGLAAIRLCRIAACLFAAPFFSLPHIVSQLGRRRPITRNYVFATLIFSFFRHVGGAYSKIGQVLGTRYDFFEDESINLLRKLQKEMPIIDYKKLAKYNNLHQFIEKNLLAVSCKPLATGSVAQVHECKTAQKQDCVLKIKKPKLDQCVNIDIRFIIWLSKIAESSGLFGGIPVHNATLYMCERFLRHLAFESEAENLAKMKSNLSGYARVPYVYGEISNADVILMEQMTDICPVDDAYEEGNGGEIAKKTMNLIYRMIFIDGFVHCDLHPGNLCYDETGMLVVLDCGFCEVIVDQLKEDFRELFLAVALNKPNIVSEVVLKNAIERPKDLDGRKFLRAISRLLDTYTGQNAAQFRVAKFVKDLFEIQARFGIYSSEKFSAIICALLVVEGAVTRNDPGLDFQKLAIEFIISNREEVFRMSQHMYGE